MAYVVNPADPTTPTNTQGSTQGAEELRALKAYILGLVGLPTGASFKQENLLINPNWNIDQINEGGLYTVNAADIRAVDGWSGTAIAPGVFKLRKLADPDNIALNCLEITCTTIDAAIAAADNYFIYTAIEGYDTAQLMAGTILAKSITIHFPFKSNVFGIYGISIGNSAGNRSYVGTINVVDGLEHDYSLTIPMDQIGAWLYTNGVGLYLRICLAAGANFQKAAGAWGADNMFTTAAQVNFMSNIANIAYLKRAQIVPGNAILPYQPADIQKELAKAQRYYEKSYDQGIAVGSVSGIGICRKAQFSNVDFYSEEVKYLVNKRADPTLTIYSDVTGASGVLRNISVGVDAAFGSFVSGQTGYVLTVNSGAASNFCSWQSTANARLS